jgi:hypothetical protein
MILASFTDATRTKKRQMGQIRHTGSFPRHPDRKTIHADRQKIESVSRSVRIVPKAVSALGTCLY